VKKIVATPFRTTVLALLLILCVFSVAVAQTDPSTSPPNQRAFHKGFLQQVLSQLSLSPDQTSQIDAILATQRAAVKPLFVQLKQDRETLMNAVANPASESVSAAASVVGGDLAQLIVAKLNTKAQIMAVLNADQQAEFEKLMKVARHGHGGFGF
jgi:Spy/CpxP family protein refolding chaperone